MTLLTPTFLTNLHNPLFLLYNEDSGLLRKFGAYVLEYMTSHPCTHNLDISNHNNFKCNVQVLSDDASKQFDDYCHLSGTDTNYVVCESTRTHIKLVNFCFKYKKKSIANIF
jgi:hypothetical protein